MEDGSGCSAPADIGISQSSLLSMKSSMMDPNIIQQQKHVMDALCIHAKNDRINLDARLVALLAELSMMTWDIICFSETRLETRDEFIEDKHRLISSNDKNARTLAARMTILVHRRCIGQINQKICLHDRVMAVDFKLPRRMVRILAVYVPNAWNYDLNYFQAIFYDINRLSMEVIYI